MTDLAPITFEVESRWLISREIRLNASSFSHDAANSLKLIDILRDNEIDVDTVGHTVEEIFYPSRFKRQYASEGVAFLSSKDIFDLVPHGKNIQNASKEYIVNPNWILVTRSGSVGRISFANKFMKNTAVSEHVIRLVPNKNTPVGYLYTFLKSKIGQPLITTNIFGGVVDEIEPNHINSIPIPRISDLEKDINQKILETMKLREDARKYILKSIDLIHEELNLAKISENSVEYFGGENGRIIKSFDTNMSSLNMRLDASYHTPLNHLAIRNIRENLKGTTKKLDTISSCFVPPRFKRAYVKNQSDGTPLLQGTHISQFNPVDIKYLWCKMKNLQAYLVKKNWILMTCSGTIGKVSLVRDHWDSWAATNHMLRIVPKENEIHPGYLTAFLLTTYGRVQFQSLIYGGVVDEIGEAGELFEDVLILKPKDRDVEAKIGNLVFQAYDKRDQANKIEDECINLLESTLGRIARAD